MSQLRIYTRLFFTRLTTNLFLTPKSKNCKGEYNEEPILTEIDALMTAI